jgi:hypothetical protein
MSHRFAKDYGIAIEKCLGEDKLLIYDAIQMKGLLWHATSSESILVKGVLSIRLMGDDDVDLLIPDSCIKARLAFADLPVDLYGISGTII